MKLFNGKQFASKKEKVLIKHVDSLKDKGIVPRLVSIVVGDEQGALAYQKLKKRAASRIGAELIVQSFAANVSKNTLEKEINKLNNDKAIDGVMIQLPLPNNLKSKTRDLINIIDPEKDVDGMREDSPFFAPVVKAVLEILEKGVYEAGKKLKPSRKRISMVIVGSSGFVGGKLIRLNFQKLFGSAIPNLTLDVEGIDIKTRNIAKSTKRADIMVSATGVPGLIKSNMVKQGAILVDVGFPKGDIDKRAYYKASFISPVPGGIGPVTIACLLENLLLATEAGL